MVATVHYFRGDGLPSSLAAIPVEVCLDGADQLAGRPFVLGTSRGSELALLAASVWPDRFAGAIGVVPSGIAHGPLRAADDGPDHAWTLAGGPVPYAQVATLDSAVIEVERIDGPLVTLVAEDDGLGPSAMLVEPALRRRAAAAHPRDRHLVLPRAGHGFFGPPGIPVPDPPAGRVHPVDGRRLEMGGTRRGDALARVQAWTVLLELLGPPPA